MQISARKTLAVLALAAGLTHAGAAAAQSRVVVTIPPVHALVAAIMEGAGEPVLLLEGGASPHSYSLRPSQARALSNAHIVVRVSERLEVFLERPLKNLAGGAEVITLAGIDGLTLHKPREGGVWEAHGHHGAEAHGHEGHEHADGGDGHEQHAHDEHEEHAHGETHEEHHEGHEVHAHEAHDPHLWLDPQNAMRIAGAVTAALQTAYPGQSARFAANAQKLTERLDRLDAKLERATAPLRGEPYFVFHDAYRYFEERYGLSPSGSITVSSDRQPGARRLSEIRERIKSQSAVCVFAEPQFEPKLVETLIAGTDARAGTLDPIGAELAPGPDLYFKLMENLATGMSACLKHPS